MHLRRVLDYLVYVVVRIFICIAQAVRMETGVALVHWLAWLFADVLKIRGHVVDDNLTHAFPEKTPAERKQLVRQMWEHLFLLVLEVAHAPRKIHETNWRDYASLRNEIELLRRLIEDRPVLVVAAHLGNFELGGYLLGILGFPTYTIARPLDNPYLHKFVTQFRGATGQHIIPKNGDFSQILDVLEHGRTMAFLADQYAGPKGCWVDFFGRQASAHKAIALLAIENNALVSVCVARRLKPLHFEMLNYALIDPREVGNSVGTIHELTQWYTTQFEEMIRLWPDQYWWLHRRWKDTRVKKQKKIAA